MADNVILPATGSIIGTDDVGGAQYQVVKVAFGANGSVTQTSDAAPLPVIVKAPGSSLHVSRYLDTAGDGTGTKNATGDYSSTADEFYIAPASDEVMLIYELLIDIEDTSGMSESEYGNIGSALSNGIQIKKMRSVTVIDDFTDGVPVLTNANWGRVAFDKRYDTQGSGNESLVVRLRFIDTGEPIRLDGALGDRLAVQLNDDFTGLVSHYFKARGVYE